MDQLPDQQRHQVVWATTWVQTPDLLGSSPRRSACRSTCTASTGSNGPTDGPFEESGKRPGLLRWLDEHEVDPVATPVVWVDDCLGPADLLCADALGVHACRVPASLGLHDVGQRRCIGVGLAPPGNRW